MAVLSVQNVNMSFGEKQLLENISFEIEERDKVGFIGANGVGKTTLFRIIDGTLSPTSGGVYKSKNTRIGYMQQHACENSKRSIYEELVSVFDYLKEIQQELNIIADKIERGNENTDELINRQLELQDFFERENGLTYESRTRSALIGFGFSEDEFDMPVNNLSGGQKSKLSLLKLLLSRSNLLLLDEPTNHLDISSVQWLEEFIKSFKGAVIIISHDRYFLDAITNKTVELEHKKVTMYKGNYSEFKSKKEKLLEDARNEYKNKLKEIKRIEGIVEQQKRWGQEHNFITAASKQKQVNRLKDELVKPEDDIQGINFDFTYNRESGNEVCVCENLSKSFDGKHLFNNISFTIRKGERIFLLGANGIGKTTLFKILLQKIRSDTGSIKWGTNVDIGYFDQVQANLSLEKEAIDEVWDDFPKMTQTQVRTALGRFLFKSDDVFKEVGKLSGGERARIALLKLMLRGDNCLLLDEPTNHLDTLSREALEDTLTEYKGTMFIISHDRYFINKLADRILLITPTGIREFLGNYDYYFEKTKDEKSKETIVQKQENKKSGGTEYKQRKERQSEFRKLNTRLKKCEQHIEEHEGRRQEIEDKLKSEEVVSNYTALTELTSELETVNSEIEVLYEEWEEIQEELVNYSDLEVNN